MPRHPSKNPAPTPTGVIAKNNTAKSEDTARGLSRDVDHRKIGLHRRNALKTETTGKSHKVKRPMPRQRLQAEKLNGDKKLNLKESSEPSTI